MRFTLSYFLAITAVASFVVARPSERALSLNPPRDVLKRPRSAAISPPPAQPVTNAKRLAQGLPPMRPRNGVLAPHHDVAYPGGGTRIASAPRSRTSPRPPKKKKCNILVKEVGGSGTVFGFISPFWNDFGEFGIVQPSQEGSLEVSFSFSKDSLTRLDLYALTTNSTGPTYPFMGGTVGFISGDDLSSGSFNWVYLTGTVKTPYGPPTAIGENSFGEATDVPKASESPIWTYDPRTNILTPQWVNTDGSTPANYLLYANDFNQAFVVTGDVEVFRSTFGAPYPAVSFTCVAPKHTQGPYGKSESE